eukprot:Phypoly_transcript_02179.p1 GENE.Phypoly_transcript_02179~~Phypoly_transcript_02179.p1  ORF type:complete len:937 (+),score=182.88 Phypoly_transcript_02179:84-2894(+)
MIKGRHGGAQVARVCRSSLCGPACHSPLPLSTLQCPHHSTTLTSRVSSPNIHASAVHTSRYIDFQITKLKKYVQEGTNVSSGGIAALLSKPNITIHQAKELLQLAKSVNCMTTALYNDYIGALNSHGDPHVVLDAIKDMEKLGLEPNIRTFNGLLHLVISNASLFPNILAQISQKGLEFDVATYNIVMRHYFLVGQSEKSLEIELLMEKSGVTPNVITFNQLLHIWAKKADPKKCDEILDRMRARNIHPTLASYTILIQLHVNKLHDVETGLRLFSEMKAQGIVPDARPYDTLIEALSARGDSQRSLELFHEMQHGGYAEGTMAYSVLIDKFTKEGKFEEVCTGKFLEGWDIFCKMKEAKEPLRAELWNVFLRFFAQRGDLAQALVLFQDMNTERVRPSTQTYNVLLSTTGMTLESKLKIWENMKELGVERDRFTFNLMIVAFMKEKRYSESEAIFNEMPAAKVQPDPHLLITMRDVYQRAGQMEKAQAMSAAAKKLVKQNLDLRDLVRKKQQKNQLQKRIEYQKDIQEVEMLLAAKHSKTNQTTILPNPTDIATLPYQITIQKPDGTQTTSSPNQTTNFDTLHQPNTTQATANVSDTTNSDTLPQTTPHSHSCSESQPKDAYPLQNTAQLTTHTNQTPDSDTQHATSSPADLQPEPAEPLNTSQPPVYTNHTRATSPEPQNTYYAQNPNPYFDSYAHQYQLYHAPFQAQYAHPSPSPPSFSSPPSPPTAGLPRRKRSFHRTPSNNANYSYSQYPPPQGYYPYPPPTSPYPSFESYPPSPPSFDPNFPSNHSNTFEKSTNPTNTTKIIPAKNFPTNNSPNNLSTNTNNFATFDPSNTPIPPNKTFNASNSAPNNFPTFNPTNSSPNNPSTNLPPNNFTSNTQNNFSTYNTPTNTPNDATPRFPSFSKTQQDYSRKSHKSPQKFQHPQTNPALPPKK